MKSRSALGLIALIAATACAAGRLDLGVDVPPGFPADPGDGADGDRVIAGGSVSINVCRPVLEGLESSLRLAGPTSSGAFQAGRRVIVLQVQSALAAQSGLPVDVADLRGAGAWEIARLTAVTTLGSDLQLSLLAPLASSYSSDATQSAQACTLPEFESLVIGSGGVLAAPAWNGRTGGILAVLARSLTLDVGGELSADGTGFRGGVLGSNGDYGSVTDFEPVQLGAAGGKGESLDVTSFTRRGRGSMANAGGGGNCANAAGGGGGNGGQGGIGGWEIGVTPDPDTAGLPGGKALTAGIALLLGGGGGAGQQDLGALGDGGSGGSGGGIVFLVAGRVQGSGTIAARGAGGSFSEQDGSGGGGAGGTVAVWAIDAALFGGAIDIAGGAGGNAGANHAPGGGGGGGRANTSLGPVDLSGGSAGKNGGTSRGERPGEPGVVSP